jgi:hypothetical protein
MQILPLTTQPPNKPFTYRHAPKPGEFHTYRNCMRWEFGFTCPFCLIHESDIVRGGCAEGFGLTGIEHVLPQSTHDDQKHIFTNCLYCCQMCNRSRSKKPLEEVKANKKTGRRLLIPTAEKWADHFVSHGDELHPVVGDDNAKYTHEAYEIDDPRKIRLREMRRKLYEDHFSFLEDDPMSQSDMLLKLAEDLTRPADERDVLIKVAKVMRAHVEHAVQDLESYEAIPKDAPKSCRCGVTKWHKLPESLQDQTIPHPMP